ncbi:MAG: hypothetical protein AUG96_01840 [Chloroflexi bacterium 13_1_20CM_4_66_15]|nr:MAG: hypothetical protein AUG96_01840 [Chloroflexi bacterium 13_1_20CM_4_66_15]TMF20438.1 MAG: hypothetical protein E6I31_12020 [Chloroflexota bacterium]TMF46094.1 MAG: hypothetical protein E6I24_09005 [Chloroflexota bacterium]TMG15475.1 MAG: hypothetical protein E6I01_07295 [Chloroflexota bacterium]TMG16734.1 MAG: hypothetical protein E6H98_09115 [Chloroflexota bacterium]
MQAASVVLVTILIELGLAGVAGFLALRLLNRRSGPTVVMGLAVLAITFGLVAIASVTFLRKTRIG